MTTHRAPQRPAQQPVRPVERAVVAGLLLAGVVGLAWIGAMAFTIAAWSG
ncbi:morphogenic membrane protein MmpA [Streptomyces lancefieldiae]|uniref:Integral membrane protein n=1 Tax=Streptomyces lancefieldiae TaxID=3075520 RepID=A0ABU3AIP0_9ACTN|nr:hypothetical protein [Streptomyces sp. DSM 40712]MDT0608761.1 hypothetical protein [Streptomyces sp. DSM 40712]